MKILLGILCVCIAFSNSFAITEAPTLMVIGNGMLVYVVITAVIIHLFFSD